MSFFFFCAKGVLLLVDFICKKKVQKNENLEVLETDRIKLGRGRCSKKKKITGLGRGGEVGTFSHSRHFSFLFFSNQQNGAEVGLVPKIKKNERGFNWGWGCGYRSEESKA